MIFEIKMDDYGFSEDTKEWLSGWLSGGKEITDLTSVVIKETKNYINHDNNEQLLLYKALTENDVLENEIISFKGPSSWTHDLDMAYNFKSVDLPIVSALIGNSNILIDTVELDQNYISRTLGGFPEEHEVILLPGTYRATIIEE